eukprot:PhM_4_TR5223/c2_g1_i1/m.54852
MSSFILSSSPPPSGSSTTNNNNNNSVGELVLPASSPPPASSSASTSNPPPPASFLSGLRGLLESGAFSDITLVPKDNADQRFRVHRAILSAQSEVFASMFSHDVQENTAATLTVPFSQSCMECVLAFIYSCDVSGLTVHNAVAVVEASSYYLIAPLTSACIDFLKRHTTNENVCDVLECALRFNLTGLQEHCVSYVRQTNADVLFSPNVGTVAPEVLLLLLQEAVIESDYRILLQCHRWALQRAVQEDDSEDEDARTRRAQSMLEPMLRVIDFGCMTAEQIEEIEQREIVPLRCMYEAFKRKLFGCGTAAATTSSLRRGGIPLQWDSTTTSHLRFADNTVLWDGSTRPLPAEPHYDMALTLNKFSRGRHYWTVVTSDLSQAGDVLVGITRCRVPGIPTAVSHPSSLVLASADSTTGAIFFDPFTLQVTAGASNIVEVASASSLTSSASSFSPNNNNTTTNSNNSNNNNNNNNSNMNSSNSRLLSCHEGCGEVGFLLDFDAGTVTICDHVTQDTLFTVASPQIATGTAYHISAVMSSRCHGAVVLCDSTTYRGAEPTLWAVVDEKKFGAGGKPKGFTPTKARKAAAAARNRAHNI